MNLSLSKVLETAIALSVVANQLKMSIFKSQKKYIQTYHNISLLKPKILHVLLFTLSITRHDFEKKKRSKKKCREENIFHFV